MGNFFLLRCLKILNHRTEALIGLSQGLLELSEWSKKQSTQHPVTKMTIVAKMLLVVPQDFHISEKCLKWAETIPAPVATAKNSRSAAVKTCK